MASSAGFKQGLLPMNTIPQTCPAPEASYEAVVTSQTLFMATLEKLHSVLGTKFMIPIIGGRDLDLHKLFVEVTSRGGIDKILKERRWKEVTATFSFPPTATNASYVLRKYYFSLLYNYEQVYFFKANGQAPPDSLQNPGTMQVAIRTAHELHALTSPQPKIDSGASLFGSNVTGVIDGKFESGYLVTVTMGTEKLKGVLYQFPQNTSSHQTPTSHGVFPITWTDNTKTQTVTGGITKRRRRRKKSEIKRRDPAHPKPNRSGYNFFFAEQHARLKPLHPGKDREISRMIGELWNGLNGHEKAVYQGKALEDKERYLTEMEDYREKLKTGELISNAVPLQQRLPEKDVEMAEAAEGEEEEEDEDEEEEGDTSGSSGESNQNGESDHGLLEEPASLCPSGINPNPQIETVMIPKEKTDDVMEENLVKKAEEEETKMVTSGEEK